MKVALVHDYLKGEGGAEQVLLALHEIYPSAPIYTIFSSIKKNSTLAEKFGGARIIESWFGKLPYKERLISPLRFLIPLIWRSLDFSDYDLVISSASWAITKGFLPSSRRGGTTARRSGVEVCYCHTPPRYLYGYETSRDLGKNIFIRIYAAVVNHFMRLYDWERAQKVDFFIANSREVQSRIKKFYRRESTVIYPPVEIPNECKVQSAKCKVKENYYITGGRLERPKNFDLIIEACSRLKLPLKIYGVGSQIENLKKTAGSTIEFMGSVTDEEKFKLLSGAKAFIAMAKDEDFGITPVEAMAAGTPVIAYRGGGYLETVIDPPSSRQPAGLRTGKGKTGVFVDDATVKSLIRAIGDFGEVGRAIKPEDCRRQAEKFNKERFKKEFEKFVKDNA